MSKQEEENSFDICARSAQQGFSHLAHAAKHGAAFLSGEVSKRTPDSVKSGVHHATESAGNLWGRASASVSGFFSTRPKMPLAKQTQHDNYNTLGAADIIDREVQRLQLLVQEESQALHTRLAAATSEDVSNVIEVLGMAARVLAGEQGALIRLQEKQSVYKEALESFDCQHQTNAEKLVSFLPKAGGAYLQANVPMFAKRPEKTLGQLIDEVAACGLAMIKQTASLSH